MAEMTSVERVMCFLRREQPDRVPHFEWLVGRKVRNVLCPGCKDYVEFAVRMGHKSDFRRFDAYSSVPTRIPA